MKVIDQRTGQYPLLVTSESYWPENRSIPTESYRSPMFHHKLCLILYDICHRPPCGLFQLNILVRLEAKAFRGKGYGRRQYWSGFSSARNNNYNVALHIHPFHVHRIPFFSVVLSELVMNTFRKEIAPLKLPEREETMGGLSTRTRASRTHRMSEYRVFVPNQ